MEKVYRRPLTEQERKRLKKYAPPLLLSFGPPIFAGGFFFMLLALPIMWLSKYFQPAKTFQPIYFAGVGIWVAYQAIVMFRNERARSRRLRDDLKGNEAEVRRFEAVEAIRVEETEDEGTGFFMKLKDGRALFVCGQHFYELEEEKTFPCSVFEVVQTPHAKWLLDFVCVGEYFAPSFARKPFGRKAVSSGRAPSDGQILEVEFESLKEP